MKKIYKTSEIIKKIRAVSISTAMLTVTIASCDKFTDISNLTKKPNEDSSSSESISDDNTSSNFSDSSEIITESSTEIAESTTTTQKTTVTRKNATSTSRSTNATSKE